MKDTKTDARVDTMGDGRDSPTASGDVAGSVEPLTPDQVSNELDDGYPYDDEDPYCYRCDNAGFIIVCVDDMCRGAGECMHGDGEIVCPDCKGESAW